MLKIKHISMIVLNSSDTHVHAYIYIHTYTYIYMYVCMHMYVGMYNNAATVRLYSNLEVNNAAYRFNEKLKLTDQYYQVNIPFQQL